MLQGEDILTPSFLLCNSLNVVHVRLCLFVFMCFRIYKDKFISNCLG